MQLYCSMGMICAEDELGLGKSHDGIMILDKNITTDARKQLLEKAHNFLPELTERTLVGHWAGLRPGSPENIPVISRHPAFDNLYLNSGHHRYGVTMALGSAHLLSNMIMKNPQPFDVAPYKWHL